MSLAPGSKLGPFEILAPLGAGGMGEVFRARDPRLGRDVAVKVLRRGSADSEALKRFLVEARAAGGLNHPAVLAVFDVGVHDDEPYVVSELLEGETLGSRLAQGPLPVRKSLEIAAQVAHGLAAAHDKGVVHRDLKPDNLFLTTDGRVKILDFGLAKLLHPDAEGAAVVTSTTGGAVMGTAGYMAPEQVSGQPPDHRTDIFSLGVVLYEMLAGRRAFQGKSPAETMISVLRDDPPDLGSVARAVPPAVERVVRRCLEKRPEDRFGSARDVAFALEALAGSATSAGTSRSLRLPRIQRLPTAPVLLLGLALAGGAFLAGRQSVKAPARPDFERLSYRRGIVTAARFGPDGKTVVYGASFDGEPYRIHVKRPEDDDTLPLDVPDADLLAVSRTGQLALMLRQQRSLPFSPSGTLALYPLVGGGAPHELLENVRGADFSPDGKRIVVVRDTPSGVVLELRELASDQTEGSLRPRQLFETRDGYLTRPRFSPQGDRIAFFHHRVREGTLGSLEVVELAGGKVTTVVPFPRASSFRQVAWAPDGQGVIFSAGVGGVVSVASLDGQVRELMRAPGMFTVHDVGADGALLATDDDFRFCTSCRAPGQPQERDLTWLGVTRQIDLSPDGHRLAFLEYYAEQQIGGLRDTTGGPVQRIGQGEPKAFSPDMKWLLLEVAADPQRFGLIPLGPGDPRALAPSGVQKVGWATFLPDGKRIVFTGNLPGKGVQLFVQDVEGGTPARPVSDAELFFTILTPSPDGRFLAAVGAGRQMALYPLDGGAPMPVPGVGPQDQPIRFAPDGSLYVFSFGPIPTPVRRVDVHTGTSTLVREIVPPDRAGVLYTAPRLLTPDGQGYCYQYLRMLSRLFLVRNPPR
jgi:Tol biopolymer transport system component/tRNA A-37 threonylcarbamoyl transferase component Bud32